MSFTKRKWLAAVTLLLLAFGNIGQMKAATIDVTSLYLKNPSFENEDVSTLTVDNNRGAYVLTNPKGWTMNAAPGVADLMTAQSTATDNNYGAPGAPSDGQYAYYVRNAWTKVTTTLSQEVTLPAGTFTLSVDTKAGSASPTAYSAQVFAGDDNAGVTIQTTTKSNNNPFLVEWKTASVTFTLTEKTTLSLGVVVNFAANGDGLSFLMDNFKLTAEADNTPAGQAIATGENLYLYNVGTGKYVNFSGLWGTYYYLSEAGMPLTITKVDGQDYYVIQTLFNGTNNHFYSYNNNINYAFSDGENRAEGEHWVFETVSGETNTYYIKNNMTGYYLTGNMDTNGGTLCAADALASTANTTWKVVSQTEMAENLDKASGANPVDANYLIKDANLIYNSTDYSAWNSQNVSVYTSNNNSRGYRAAEIYQAIGKLSQTVTFPKKGTYKLSVSAFQSAGEQTALAEAYADGTDSKFAVVYAGDRASYVQCIFDEAGNNGEVGGENATYGYIPNSLLTAGQYFWDETLYRGSDNSVLFYVDEDNKEVEIGFQTLSNATQYWTAFDNFRLAYLGEDDLTNSNADATPSITAEGVYIYNTKYEKYINQGEYGGTSAVLETEGGVDFIMAQGTNGYTFESKIGLPSDFNSTRVITGNYYLYDYNGKIYTDGNGESEIANEFKLAQTDKANVFYIYEEVDGVRSYLTTTDQKNVTTTSGLFIVNDDANQWKIQTKTDRVARLSEATDGVGVDATFYIEDPDFAVKNSRINAWTIDGIARTYGEWWSRNKASTSFSPYTAWLNDCRDSKSPANYYGRDLNNIKKYSFPAMNRTDYGKVEQTLTGLKNGVYVLSCQGFYSDGNPNLKVFKGYWNDNVYVRRAFLFANDNRVALRALTENLNTTSAYGIGNGAVVYDNDFDDYYAGAEFYNGNYPNQIPVIVTDGTLKIGIVKDSRRDEDFAAFDQFRLTYYGEATDVDALTAAFNAAYNTTKTFSESFSSHADVTSDEAAQLTSLVSEYGTAPTTAAELTTAINTLNEFNRTYDEAIIAYDIYKILKNEYDNEYYTEEKWPYASEVKRQAMEDAFANTPTNLSASVNAINDLRLYVESNAKAELISEQKATDPEFDAKYSIDARNFTKEANITNPDFSNGTNGWSMWHNGNTGGGLYSNDDLRRAQYFPRYADEAETTLDNHKMNYLGYSGKPMNFSTSQQVTGLLAGQYIVTVSLAPTGNARVKATVTSTRDGQQVGRSVSSLPITASNGGAYTNGWYDTWFVTNITNSSDVVSLEYQMQGGTSWTWATSGIANVRIYKIDEPQEFYLDEDKTDLTYLPEYGKTNAKCVLHRSFDVNEWNSLILPVSLDYEQFTDAFGDGAQLAKIKGLDETHLREGAHSLIVFEEVELGTNLPAVEAGVHYIIKPTKEAPFTEGQYTLIDEVTTVPAPYYLLDNISIEGRDDLIILDTLYTTETEPTQHIYYKGQYVKQNIPAGSYAFSKGDLYHIASSLPMKGFRCWIEDSEDPTVKSNLSFQVDMLDGETATVIEGIEVSDPANAAKGADNVYSVSGQLVGKASELNTLPKGVYVVNGKKIVVK